MEEDVPSGQPQVSPSAGNFADQLERIEAQIGDLGGHLSQVNAKVDSIVSTLANMNTIQQSPSTSLQNISQYMAIQNSLYEAMKSYH